MTEIVHRIDVDTLHRDKTTTLGLNDIVRVRLEFENPLAFDPYALNRETGSFVLVQDRSQQAIRSTTSSQLVYQTVVIRSGVNECVKTIGAESKHELTFRDCWRLGHYLKAPPSRGEEGGHPSRANPTSPAKETRLFCLPARLGFDRSRNSHSRFVARANAGARFTSPDNTSKLPPTPWQTRTFSFGPCSRSQSS